MVELKFTSTTLEWYAFVWSLLKMVIAAVSLFFGATPVALRVVGYTASQLLPLFWIISGVAAGYLGYRWYVGGQTVFGGKNTLDGVAFTVLVITGINLGITGLSTNIGMMLAGTLGALVAGLLYKLTALVYLWVAYYLYRRWNASGKHVFTAGTTTPSPAPQA